VRQRWVVVGGTPAPLCVLCDGKCCFLWELCVCASGLVAHLWGGGSRQDASECETRLVECAVGIIGRMRSRLTYLPLPHRLPPTVAPPARHFDLFFFV